MVRPEIAKIISSPPTTLGGLAKWFDRAQQTMQRNQPITGEEQGFVDGAYFEYADSIAKEQDLPLAFVLNGVAELVRSRIMRDLDKQMELDLG